VQLCVYSVALCVIVYFIVTQIFTETATAAHRESLSENTAIKNNINQFIQFLK